MSTWEWPNTPITRVVDGDTFDATVVSKVKQDVGFAIVFEQTVSFPVRLRLNRINAAKSSTKRGKAATARLIELTTGVLTHLTTIKHYKYGGPDDSVAEYMAELVLPDGRNVSDVLVAEKLADYWDGNGPRPDDS